MKKGGGKGKKGKGKDGKGKDGKSDGYVTQEAYNKLKAKLDDMKGKAKGFPKNAGAPGGGDAGKGGKPCTRMQNVNIWRVHQRALAELEICHSTETRTRSVLKCENNVKDFSTMC